MTKSEATKKIKTAIKKLHIETKDVYTVGEMQAISAEAFGIENKDTGLGYVMQVLKYGAVKWAVI